MMIRGKYNRKNFLLRVIDIQEIYQERHAAGCTNEAIYKMHIYDRFKISRSTFYNYLTIPAKKQLKELERKLELEREMRGRQLDMFKASPQPSPEERGQDAKRGE